jgi:hypothetical protein
MEDKTDERRVTELYEMLDKLGALHDDFAHMTVRYVLDRNWDKAAETAAQADETLKSIGRCITLIALAPNR